MFLWQPSGLSLLLSHSFHSNAFKRKDRSVWDLRTSSVSYLRVSSSSPSTSLKLILHLCVLQALDTFSHSSPSVGRQRAFQPGGHKAAIPANQWQINQCYLFFPCLCCDRFFSSPRCYFAVCCDLNFAQLSQAHFQRQIVIAQGLPSSESDASVGAG